MSGLFKRFAHREPEDIEGITPSPQNSITGSNDPSGPEKDVGVSSARQLQEVEANRKLSVFERAHRWDPNLDDEQLLEIDDAVNARDPNAEGKLYDEVFENSPYPEVCLFMSTSVFSFILFFQLGVLAISFHSLCSAADCH